MVSGNFAALGSTSDKMDNLAASLMHSPTVMPRSARNKTVGVVRVGAGGWTEKTEFLKTGPTPQALPPTPSPEEDKGTRLWEK